MKKIISLMLAMVLLCGCLVGCGSDKKVATVALDIKGGYQYYGFDLSPKEFNKRFNRHITVKENKMTKVTNEKAYKEGDASYEGGNGISNGYLYDTAYEKVKFICTLYDASKKTDRSINQFKDAIQASIKVINPSIKADELNSILNQLDFDGFEKWSPDTHKRVEMNEYILILRQVKQNDYSFSISCKLEKAK